MKRILSLLIVLSMMLMILAACADSSVDSRDTGKTPTTAAQADTTAPFTVITADVEPIDESLAALNYGGDRTVVILARDDGEVWAQNEL